jgi:hypothetical protein
MRHSVVVDIPAAETSSKANPNNKNLPPENKLDWVARLRLSKFARSKFPRSLQTKESSANGFSASRLPTNRSRLASAVNGSNNLATLAGVEIRSVESHAIIRAMISLNPLGMSSRDCSTGLAGLECGKMPALGNIVSRITSRYRTR